MDFLVLIFIIYFVVSMFSRNTQEAKKKNRPIKSIDELKESFDTFRENHSESAESNRPLRRNETRQTRKIIQQSDHHQLSPKHFTASNQSRSSNRKQTVDNLAASLDDLSNRNLTNRIDDFSERYASVFDEELKELEARYSDTFKEDDSWLGLDDDDILMEVVHTETIEGSNDSIYELRQMFKNPSSVRKGIVFSEIISKPKALRKK